VVVGQGLSAPTADDMAEVLSRRTCLYRDDQPFLTSAALTAVPQASAGLPATDMQAVGAPCPLRYVGVRLRNR
jgi:hypothetical protein